MFMCVYMCIYICVCVSIPSLILLRKWSGSNSKGFKLQVSNVALLFDGHETHSNGEIYPIHLWPSAERVSPSPSGSGGSDPETALAAVAPLARPGADNMAWQVGFPWGSTTNRQGFIDHHSWGVTGWIPKTIYGEAPSSVSYLQGRRPRHPCPTPERHPPPAGPSWSALGIRRWQRRDGKQMEENSKAWILAILWGVKKLCTHIM
jgi:hypothetical protein